MSPERIYPRDARTWATMIIAASLENRDAEVLVRLASIAGADVFEVQRLVAAASRLVHTAISQPLDLLTTRRM